MKLICILSVVRVAVVPLALAKLLMDRGSFPPDYERGAWWLLSAQALVAAALLALALRRRSRLRRLAMLNVAADFALAAALLLVYTWDPDQPLRTLPYLVVLEAALFFRLRGGVLVAVLTVPLFAAVELWRDSEFGTTAAIDSIVLRGVIALALGGIVGRLVDMERGQARAAHQRAAEAERLRDELGRRIDLREATSRAARALGSSLDLDGAFAAFVHELRGLLPFDRAAILMVDGSGAAVMATAGVAHDEVIGPGSSIPIAGSVLEPVIGDGRTVYREDISEQGTLGYVFSDVDLAVIVRDSAAAA